MKILFFDGTGMVIFYKGFDSSVVKLPSDAAPGTKQVEIDDAILEALLEGLVVTRERHISWGDSFGEANVEPC